MKNRNTISPKVKSRITLKKVLVVGGSFALIAGIAWKFLIGTTATLVNPSNVVAMFTPATGQQLSGFNWTNTLTVDHTQVIGSSDLVDFPMLVSLNATQLKSTANGGYVNNPNGYDIVFSGANDKQLDHEIEYYNPATGEYRAWVRLPILFHDMNTELRISCGNTSFQANPTTQDTWSNDFEAVWHMDNDPSNSELRDAAGTFNGVSYGQMTSSDVVPGRIGKAIDFDGTNDYFAIKDKYYEGNGSTTQLTVSAWIKTTHNNNNWTSNWSIVDFDRSEHFNFFVHGKGKASFSTRGSGINDFHGGNDGQLNDGEWHQMTGVFDGTKKFIYIDGVLVGTNNNPHNGSLLGTDTKRFGFIGDGSEAASFNGSRNGINFSGQLDEIRILNVAKSADWIATEFNNQTNPETFATLGTGSSLPIELDYFVGELNENTVDLEWNVLSQRNNDYFTIERSVNGKDFEVLGTVDGEGTTTKKKKYRFSDDKPLIGLSYYRLKQTDFDGKMESFNVIAINYSPKVDHVKIESVYPNPFTSDFNIKYAMSTAGQIEITLANSNGIVVFKEEVYANEGANKYQYYADYDLPKGMYFLSIVQDGKTMTSSKLIKQ